MKLSIKFRFGIFGSIAHVLFVRRTLERIFRYRLEKLDELFRRNNSQALRLTIHEPIR